MINHGINFTKYNNTDHTRPATSHNLDLSTIVPTDGYLYAYSHQKMQSTKWIQPPQTHYHKLIKNLVQFNKHDAPLQSVCRDIDPKSHYWRRISLRLPSPKHKNIKKINIINAAFQFINEKFYINKITNLLMENKLSLIEKNTYLEWG